MNLYLKKQRWKWMLAIIAVVIVGLSLWYTNLLVRSIANEERNKVKLWADAIQKKAELVKNTEILFDKIKENERKKMKLWAKATRRLVRANNSEDLTFYSEIISGNQDIPVILVNENNKIIASKNVSFNTDSINRFEGKLENEFSAYEPIEVSYGRYKNYLYYKDSKVFTLLRETLNDIIQSFISEVVINSASVPVIITDSTKANVMAFGNLDTAKIANNDYIQETISSMQEQNKPIEIELSQGEKQFIFYKDSLILMRLRFFPYVQIGIIALFILVAYLLFSTFRKAEQNKVWLGMAKETAHQLGTPLSSLVAWIEILKIKGVDNETLDEILKDINRLETVTQRFSNIGSQPKLKSQNLVEIINETIHYMQRRTSKKIKFSFNLHKDKEINIPVNKHLFEWVLENLFKNAVDAINREGKIETQVKEEDEWVIIDVMDNGKGIPKSKQRSIFHPGYTSKNRGWGLGLSLSERIINHYHAGKIFVKQSVVNKGTTIRIVLKKKLS